MLFVVDDESDDDVEEDDGDDDLFTGTPFRLWGLWIITNDNGDGDDNYHGDVAVVIEREFPPRPFQNTEGGKCNFHYLPRPKMSKFPVTENFSREREVRFCSEDFVICNAEIC